MSAYRAAVITSLGAILTTTFSNSVYSGESAFVQLPASDRIVKLMVEVGTITVSTGAYVASTFKDVTSVTWSYEGRANLADFGTDTIPAGTFLQSFPINEWDSLQDARVRSRRLVSMSMWLSYIGSELNSSGQVISDCIADRSPPFQPHLIGNPGTGSVMYDNVLRYTSIRDLANVKGAYDGALRDGTYIFWKPEDRHDLGFVDFQSRWDWRSPYLVANVFQPSTAGQMLRIRIVRNYECLTLDRRFPLTYSLVDFAAYEMAFRLLLHMPAAMENTFHLGKIGDFLGGALNKAKNLARSVVNNPLVDDITSVIPGGSAALSLGRAIVGGAGAKKRAKRSHLAEATL